MDYSTKKEQDSGDSYSHLLRQWAQDTFVASLEFYKSCRLLAIGCLEHYQVFLLFLFRKESVCKVSFGWPTQVMPVFWVRLFVSVYIVSMYTAYQYAVILFPCIFLKLEVTS